MNNQSTLWKTIFSLAFEIQKEAPWEYMEESDIFGIRMPESGQLYFISIMGSGGEVFAISAYKGARALAQFWQLYDSYNKLPPETVLTIPQIMLSFEEKDILDRDQLEKLRKYAVKPVNGLWPVVQQYIPGYVPCEPDEESLNDMVIILEQTLNILVHLKINIDILFPVDEDENIYMVREFCNPKNNPTWIDNYIPVDFPSVDYNIECPVELFQRISALPRRMTALQVDIFMSPAPVDDKKTKAYYPFILLVVRKKDGIILGHRLITPIPDLDSMYETVPQTVLELIAENRYIPSAIELKQGIMEAVLRPVMKDAMINTIVKSKLDKIEEAKEGIISTLTK